MDFEIQTPDKSNPEIELEKEGYSPSSNHLLTHY